MRAAQAARAGPSRPKWFTPKPSPCGKPTRSRARRWFVRQPLAKSEVPADIDVPRRSKPRRQPQVRGQARCFHDGPDVWRSRQLPPRCARARLLAPPLTAYSSPEPGQTLSAEADHQHTVGYATTKLLGSMPRLYRSAMRGRIVLAHRQPVLYLGRPRPRDAPLAGRQAEVRQAVSPRAELLVHHAPENRCRRAQSSPRRHPGDRGSPTSS
jgi:hypothetical protein